MKAAWFRIGVPTKTQPVFVLGYGRSGTTMLLDTFEHDMRIEVLRENDPRIASDYLLLREQVGPAIAACRAPVFVLKPILNSFDLLDLMREHQTSRVIWTLRRYDAVIASALKRFGNSVADELREVVVDDRGEGWLRRGLPPSTLTRLRSLEWSGFGPNEWMALVWWSVNLTLLSRDLANNPRFLLVRYEELTRNPEHWMKGVYAFIGLEYRRESIQWIDSRAATRSVHVDLNDDVRDLCERLTADIGAAFNRAASHPTIVSGTPS